MDDADDGLLYLAAGPLAAIFLGMLLVPLRDFTSASNFTFVFMALTIAIAALGGEHQLPVIDKVASMRRNGRSLTRLIHGGPS